MPVSDNRLGIAGTLRRNISNLRFTTETLGRGAGSGLALARDMIVDHRKGRLHLNEEKLASSFSIEMAGRSDSAGELSLKPILG